MSLSNMANASNENRNQHIMQLKQDFNKCLVTTLESAHQRYGYTKPTIRKWAIDGNIPLFDPDKHDYVVPLTDKNRPNWTKTTGE